MQEKSSTVISLSERRSKRLPPSPTSVKNAGRRAALQKILSSIHELSTSPNDFIAIAAVLSASMVQGSVAAGFSCAPLLFAAIYEEAMKDGTSS